MKTICALLIPLAALASACRGASDSGEAARAAAPKANGFDQAAAGALPAGWVTGSTNPADLAATWAVREDASAVSPPNVLSLTETGHQSKSTFNVCWTNDVQFTDGALEVSVRADAGEVDQGGGPMWRVVDANTYYVCRFNPLEGNFRVYVVKYGARLQLASADVDCAVGEWHRVRIEHVGSHITCSLDGQKLLEVNDPTLPGGGGIGLWTKADARTSFDDLQLP